MRVYAIIMYDIIWVSHNASHEIPCIEPERSYEDGAA